MPNQVELRKLVNAFIRDNTRARSAFQAMRHRGLPETEAVNELGCALMTCLRETALGRPNRSARVLEALAEGRSTAQLFRIAPPA